MKINNRARYENQEYSEVNEACGPMEIGIDYEIVILPATQCLASLKVIKLSDCSQFQLDFRFSVNRPEIHLAIHNNGEISQT